MVLNETTYFAAKDGDDYVVMMRDRNGEKPHLIAGADPIAQQWTAWYADTLRREQSQEWVDSGLRVFTTSNGNGMLFLWRGLPVGTIGWNGLEWFWWNLEHWGNQYGGGKHIEVDAHERLKFVQQRDQIPRQPEHLHSTLYAELHGRTQVFRDETADLVMLWGKSRALRVGRAYDASGVTYRCTGYYDQDGGFVDHQGESCPVHENTEPCPHCKATGSRFYNGEANAICPDCDGRGRSRVLLVRPVEPCPYCNAIGQRRLSVAEADGVGYTKPCPDCDGTGYRPVPS